MIGSSLQTLTHRGNCSKLWSTVKGLSSINAKTPANRGIYLTLKKLLLTMIQVKAPKSLTNNTLQTPRKMKNKNTLRTIKITENWKYRAECLSVTQ